MTRLDELIEMRQRIDDQIDEERRQLRAMGVLRDDVDELLSKWSTPTRVTLEAAAEAFGVSVVALLNKNREPSVDNARHVAASLLRGQGLSYPAIGRLLGRDHTTMMNSCRRVSSSLMLTEVVAQVRGRLLEVRHDSPQGSRQDAYRAVASPHHVKGQ